MNEVRLPTAAAAGAHPPAAEVTAAGLLQDPNHLLHALNPEIDTAAFLQVTEARLRETAFLDGRTQLSDRPPVVASGVLAAGVAPSGPGPTRRYIFHGAFCGSTLLARLLDHPGRTLVLREPHVLADLADRKLETPESDARLQAYCDLAAASLFHPRRPGEKVVVKPSNWVNNLLPELCADGDHVRAVFIETSLREFLTAAFRGGSERLRFMAKAAARLSHGDAEGEALLAKAERDGADPLAQAANVAVVLHALQRRRSSAARARAGWTQAQVIDRDRLISDPLAAVRVANTILELALPDEVLSAANDKWSVRYSKDAELAYGPDIHAAVDRDVKARFRDGIRAACAWAERNGLETG